MVLTLVRRTTGIDRCIQNCEEAHDVGLALVDYCLKKGGDYAVPDTIKILEDSSEIARTAADFMLRDSDRHTTVCRGCAAICEEAARRLEQRPEDELFRWGVELFRKCSQSCEVQAGIPLGS